MKYGTVAKSGMTYSFKGEKVGVGMEASKQKLAEDKKMLAEMEKLTKEAANANPGFSIDQEE